MKWPGDLAGATFHILVPHASVILLGYGPPSRRSPVLLEGSDALYRTLMETWFSEEGYVVPQVRGALDLLELLVCSCFFCFGIVCLQTTQQLFRHKACWSRYFEHRVTDMSRLNATKAFGESSRVCTRENLKSRTSACRRAICLCLVIASGFFWTVVCGSATNWYFQGSKMIVGCCIVIVACCIVIVACCTQQLKMFYCILGQMAEMSQQKKYPTHMSGYGKHAI